MVETGEIAQISNFSFFHNVFYGICILKSFNSHISVVVHSKEASLNFGWSQNGALGNGLMKLFDMQ